MSGENLSVIKPEWKNYQRIAFRIAFVFFIVQCVPTDFSWYERAAEIDWTNLHFRDIYQIARFEPEFIKMSQADRFGWAGFTNWGVVFAFAVVAGVIWTFFDRSRKEYNKLYYWLQVIVRYRAGIGIIGFCWEKVFPMQMMYPSISLLNNDFGDLTGHKVFWLSVGIVPWYQVFTGLLEFTSGFLLFFRKTVVLGSTLLIATLAAVGVVNIAYDNASHVYAFFFALSGFFLLVPYIPKIYRLLILELPAQAQQYRPAFSTPIARYGRLVLKYGAIVVFCPLMAYLTYQTFLYDPYKQPPVAGVPGLEGYYDVREFRLNGQVIPYDPSDSTRWSEAIFEKWTSLAIRVNRPVQLSLSNSGGYESDHAMRGIGRAFEMAGVAGGRRVFHYYADTITQTLYLLDKNIPQRNLKRSRSENVPLDTVYPVDWISAEAWGHIGDERTKINPKAGSTLRDKAFAVPDEKEGERQKMVLRYQIEQEGDRVILNGTNEYRDSVHVVLSRVNKHYALSESTLEAGDYDVQNKDN